MKRNRLKPPPWNGRICSMPTEFPSVTVLPRTNAEKRTPMRGRGKRNGQRIPTFWHGRFRVVGIWRAVTALHFLLIPAFTNKIPRKLSKKSGKI